LTQTLIDRSMGWCRMAFRLGLTSDEAYASKTEPMRFAA